MPGNTQYFKINPDTTAAEAEVLTEYKSKLSAMADSVDSFKAKLQSNQGAIANLGEVLDAIKENLIYNGRRVEQVGAVARWCAARYNNAEKTICGQKPSVQETAPGSIPAPPAIPDLQIITPKASDGGKKDDKWTTDYYKEKIGWTGSNWGGDWGYRAKRTWAGKHYGSDEQGVEKEVNIDERRTDWSFGFLNPTKKKPGKNTVIGDLQSDLNKKASNYLADKDLGLIDSKSTEKGDDGKWHEVDGDNTFSKDLVGVEIAGIRGSVDKTKLRASVEKTGALGTASASAAVLTAAAAGSLGLGVHYVEKNGKKVLAAGLSAEGSASASVLEGKAAAETAWQPKGMKDILGDEFKLAAAKAEGEAKVLSAEVSGAAKCRWVDGHPEVSAEVSGGAYLAKASAKGSVTALGVTASAKGEVSVGIGGSAKIGVTGGKVRCELGVALGIGAKVSFELDVSGAVSAVKNGVSAVVKNASAVKMVAGKVVDEVGDFAKKAWDTLTCW